MCTEDNCVLVSAASSEVFISLVLFHKLDVDSCIWVPGDDKEFRKLVTEKLQGLLREDQIVGCFLSEERVKLLKKKEEPNAKRKSDKVARNTASNEPL